MFTNSSYCDKFSINSNNKIKYPRNYNELDYVILFLFSDLLNWEEIFKNQSKAINNWDNELHRSNLNVT